jgi:hypothetical protein
VSKLARVKSQKKMKQIILLILMMLAINLQAQDVSLTDASDEAIAYYKTHPKSVDILQAMKIGLSIALKQKGLKGSDADLFEVSFASYLEALYTDTN